MKVGVLSDTHIGRCVPRAIGDLRREAYRHAFTQAINIFIEEGVDCLIHAGDVFEKRSMRPEDSVFVKKELQRLADSIRERQGKDVVMFVVRGNHDGMPENSALDYITHPLARYLRVIGDALLQGEEEFYECDGLRIAGLSYHPYISRKFEGLKAVLKKSLAGEAELKIMVLHSFIEGYHPIPPGIPQHNLLKARDLEDVEADLVIAGHCHTRMAPINEGGKVLLTPGATEAVDLSDEGPHGVYILEGKDSIRFVPIRPLHEIRNAEVTSEGAVKPVEWFVEEALREAEAYASDLRMRGVEGILRLVIKGLTDGDPYGIEQRLAPELANIKDASPGLLHVELDNRVGNVRHPIVLPPLGGGLEFVAEVLKQLGGSAQEAMGIVEEVATALDEKASQKTGLLTDSDRAPFVKRWEALLEEAEFQP